MLGLLILAASNRNKTNLTVLLLPIIKMFVIVTLSFTCCVYYIHTYMGATELLALWNNY